MSANGEQARTGPAEGTCERTLRVGRTARSMHATRLAGGRDRGGSARLQSFEGNELASIAEEVRASVESVAAGIEETATAAQELARSQQSVAETAKTLRESSEASAATFQELLGASIGAVKKDATPSSRRGSEEGLRPRWSSSASIREERRGQRRGPRGGERRAPLGDHGVDDSHRRHGGARAVQRRSDRRGRRDDRRDGEGDLPPRWRRAERRRAGRRTSRAPRRERRRRFGQVGEAMRARERSASSIEETSSTTEELLRALDQGRRRAREAARGGDAGEQLGQRHGGRGLDRGDRRDVGEEHRRHDRRRRRVDRAGRPVGPVDRQERREDRRAVGDQRGRGHAARGDDEEHRAPSP